MYAIRSYYEADGNIIADLELSYKRDERIIRHLTTKLDKHAVAYNEKKRRKAMEEKAQEA